MLHNVFVRDRYFVRSTLPYLILSIVFLTSILLAQQAMKFSEVLSGFNAPLGVTLKFLGYLLPSILIFTIPAATIVGILIGMGRMNRDSELIAFQAAGFGKAELSRSILLLGLTLSILTFMVSFHLAPKAASNLKKQAYEGAIRNLESPIEPKIFYTQIPGKVLYIREINREKGEWGRVFIYWPEGDETLRLVTAKSGRVDIKGQQAELVLTDAEVVTLRNIYATLTGSGRAITVERSSSLRMKDDRLNENRERMVKEFQGGEKSAEEKDWQELFSSMNVGNREIKLNASLVFHRKLSLCFAPALFSFLCVGMSFKSKIGARGVGFLLSIFILLSYYLLAVGGENLVKSHWLPVYLGFWLANIFVFIIGLAFFVYKGKRFKFNFNLYWQSKKRNETYKNNLKHELEERSFFNKPIGWGLLDKYIITMSVRNFLITILLLISVYIAFTLFDLLRFFKDANQSSTQALVQYILFLTPYAYNELAPMGAFIGSLVTYAALARSRESVASIASGQSAFRLMMPGLLFSIAIGLITYIAQDKLLPYTNRFQNMYRMQIKGGSQTSTDLGQQWLALKEADRIYAYEINKERLKKPLIFEFDEEGVHLKKIIAGDDGEESESGGVLISDVETYEIEGLSVKNTFTSKYMIKDLFDLFKKVEDNPDEMSFKQLSDSIKLMQSREDASEHTLSIGLERKRSNPFAPLVLSLIGMPLAFYYLKRGVGGIALVIPIVVGLGFWITRSLFHYMGNEGILNPFGAAWIPLLVFGVMSLYFLSRTRT